MRWIILPVALGLSACNVPSAPLTEAAAEVSRLSSGEILQELHVINTGEIALAQLALEKSQNPHVRQAAEMIIRDHSALDQRVAALATAQGVQLDASVLSQGTRAQVALIESELSQLSGPEFDRAYLVRNVELHEVALNTVQTDLLPAAQTPQVRDLLTDAVPQLEQHLQEARRAL